MSREIKFRAWNDVQMFMEEVETLYLDDEPASNIHLMQHTGLRDKNGVEIYEGDIVQLADEFDEEGVFAIEWQVNGYWLDGWDGNEYGFPDESSLEVIGNIYENPELLNA